MAVTVSRLDLLRQGVMAFSSVSNVTTTVRWRSRATVPNTPSPPPEQMIVVGSDLADLATRLLRKPHPIMASAFTSRLVKVAQDAYWRWPVATGYSRSLLAADWQTDGDDRLTFEIRADADYSTAIHDGETVQELLVRPVHAAAKQIAADIAKGIGS